MASKSKEKLIQNEPPNRYAFEPYKISCSTSEQNVYYTYVCLISEDSPLERSQYLTPIQTSKTSSCNAINPESEDIDQEHARPVERSKAAHNLDYNADPVCNKDASIHQLEEEYDSDETFISYDNPNVLKLTRMKWLTDGSNGYPDASSWSVSPSISSTSSSLSQGSVIDLFSDTSDKYFTTIVNLDKELNMFGLSDVTDMCGDRRTWVKNEGREAVFPQTAIVQLCIDKICTKGCCKNVSQTDFPCSLKCAACTTCCIPCFNPCVATCPPAGPCSAKCTGVSRACLSCCAPKIFYPDCCNDCYGMKITLKTKPKHAPYPVEITPRAPCVLQKPLAARSCHHVPPCVSPNPNFPYLMPCFWPARLSAPCSDPRRCFHNPPCPAERRPKPLRDCHTACATGLQVCGDKCKNASCLGAPPTSTQQLPYADQSIVVYHGILKKLHKGVVSSIFHTRKKKHSKLIPIFNSVFHKKKQKHTLSIFHINHHKKIKSILHDVLHKTDHNLSSLHHDGAPQKKHKKHNASVTPQKKDLKHGSSILATVQKKDIKCAPKGVSGAHKKLGTTKSLPGTSENPKQGVHAVLQGKKGQPPVIIVNTTKKKKWSHFLFRQTHQRECIPACTPCFVRKPTIGGVINKMKGIKTMDLNIQTTIGEDILKRKRIDMNIQTSNEND